MTSLPVRLAIKKCKMAADKFIRFIVYFFNFLIIYLLTFQRGRCSHSLSYFIDICSYLLNIVYGFAGLYCSIKNHLCQWSV